MSVSLDRVKVKKTPKAPDAKMCLTEVPFVQGSTQTLVSYGNNDYSLSTRTVKEEDGKRSHKI